MKYADFAACSEEDVSFTKIDIIFPEIIFFELHLQRRKFSAW